MRIFRLSPASPLPTGTHHGAFIDGQNNGSNDDGYWLRGCEGDVVVVANPDYDDETQAEVDERFAAEGVEWTTARAE